MSTLRKCLLSGDWVKSVNCLYSFLKSVTPSFVSRSQRSVRSISVFFPEECSAMILILSEFRILHIVDVDSSFFSGKIFFPKIVLSKVVLPELVSPKRVSKFSYKVKTERIQMLQEKQWCNCIDTKKLRFPNQLLSVFIWNLYGFENDLFNPRWPNHFSLIWNFHEQWLSKHLLNFKSALCLKNLITTMNKIIHSRHQLLQQYTIPF